jgi:hypothetical protein
MMRPMGVVSKNDIGARRRLARRRRRKDWHEASAATTKAISFTSNKAAPDIESAA